jgi:hypothetical protein
MSCHDVERIYCAARSAGRFGAFRRFGFKAVPREARGFVLHGELTLTAARCEAVWQSASVHQVATIKDIRADTGLCRESLKTVIAMLHETGALQLYIANGRLYLQALPPAPKWSDFLIARCAA